MLCSRCRQLHAVGVACAPGPGARVGEFELVRELGRGSSGVVFAAQHATTRQEVALKVVHRALVGDEAHTRRLLREGLIARQLGTPWVARVLSSSADDGALGPWCVMEWIRGETFLQLARQRVPADEALRLLALTADALAQAHARQLVHAALKPSNVLRVAAGGPIVLLPFGVPSSPPADAEASDDHEVDTLGSPELRAPEQWAGAPADPRMDIYALGGIAYFFATGRMPYNAPTPQALERAHADVVPIAPHRVNPRISRAWSIAILRALEKKPEDRFQSMAELAQAFRDAPAAPDPVGTTTGMFTRPSLDAAKPVAAKIGVVVLGAEPERAYEPILTPAPSSPSAVMGLVLRATVTDDQGQNLGEFTCSSVTKSGLVVCTQGALPRLLSAVKLVFADLDGLSCQAQVVQHISAEQAVQWRMSAGFGVAFTALSPEGRARLEAAQGIGARIGETPSKILQRPDDPYATEVLNRFSEERAKDGYGLFGLSKAAPFEAIQARVRQAKKALEDLADRPLSGAQIKALPEAKARVDEVGRTLCDPRSRLEYDAARGNYEGVARCISAGISVTELEAARSRFLESRPGLSGKSNGFLLAAQTHEALAQNAAALQTYSDILKFDPLNLTAHQRYQSVRRKLDGA